MLFCLSGCVAEYLEEMKEYAPTYTLWSGSEEELAEPLKGVANCLDRCFQETEEQVRQLSDSLAPALHEYVLCAETLKVQRTCTSPHMLFHNPHVGRISHSKTFAQHFHVYLAKISAMIC